MLAQLEQYDDQDLKAIYSKIKLFDDPKEIKKVSNVVTQQRNSLSAINTYNNNILKLVDSSQLSKANARNESILEQSKTSNDNSPNLVNAKPTALLSSLQNLTKLVDTLNEKMKMTDLSGSVQMMPELGIAKNIGKAVAVAGAVAIGTAVLSRPDQTSDKLNRTAGNAIQKSDQRLETTKVSEQSFASQFANFMASLFTGGLIGGAINAVTGGGEDYSNLKPAGDSAHAGQAMSFFQSKGWTKEQAAGIVGNLQQESKADLDPNAKNEIGMYGIAQWDTDRRNKFNLLYGKSIYGSSFEEQLNYVQYELTEGSRKGAGNRLKAARDPKEAALIVNKYYEGAEGQADGKRIANAIALAGGDYEKTTSSKNVNVSTSAARKGTIWKGRDKSGLITFVSKTNDPRNGKVKYETWTNQDSTHYPISEEDANTQIKSRKLTSNNTALQKDAQRSSGYTITGSYGTDRGDHIHGGVDIKASIGTPVYSIMDGIISRSEYSKTYGNVIYVDHTDGTQTRYAHLSQRMGSKGQRVSAGQLIGKSGNTGRSEGEHLHFEVRKNGQSINPSGYGNPLNGNPDQVQSGQPRSQQMLATSTQSAMNKAHTKRHAPTIIVKNNMITKNVKQPMIASQSSQTKQMIRPTTEYFDYLI